MRTTGRYAKGVALALLLAGAGPAEGQTRVRVEYRDGPVGVAIALGDLPVRLTHPRALARGWVAAQWGPVRMWVDHGRPYWGREVLSRNDLRYLLGPDMVRRIERHARAMGLRGPLQGRWYRVDRLTSPRNLRAPGLGRAETGAPELQLPLTSTRRTAFPPKKESTSNSTHPLPPEERTR